MAKASEATTAAAGRRWLADKLEEEAREELASFLEHGDPGVDFPLLRSRLNQLRRRGANSGGRGQSGGGGDGQTDAPVLFNQETRRQISEYVRPPFPMCVFLFWGRKGGWPYKKI